MMFQRYYHTVLTGVSDSAHLFKVPGSKFKVAVEVWDWDFEPNVEL